MYKRQVQALLQDKVDCVVIDQQPAEEFVEANEGLKILDTEYVVEDYAAAVSLSLIHIYLAELSRPFGTEIRIDGGVGFIDLK